MTEGLDGLRERLAEYRGLGARFAKWRAVITIGDGIPSDLHRANAHALARYAALCQEGARPDRRARGADGRRAHDRALHEVTERTLHERVRGALRAARPARATILLKPNMVVSGTEVSHQAGVREVAERTLRCLRAAVPAAVPGIVFLSGGQSDEDATAHLNAMNRIGGAPPGALLLLRPRAPGRPRSRPGPAGENRDGRAARLLPSGALQRRSTYRQLHRRDGAGRRPSKAASAAQRA